MKKLAVALACLLLATSCAKQPAPTPGTGVQRPTMQSSLPQLRAPAAGDLVAEIETSEGLIQVLLFQQVAPLAVRNLAQLAQDGYYDGTTFHRVVRDFVIQGGQGDEAVQSAFGSLFGSEASDEAHHLAGALCMAAVGEGRYSTGTQFYIVAAPAGGLSQDALAQLEQAGYPDELVAAYAQLGGLPYLDNTDTVFGQVYAGMEVVDAIAAANTNQEDVPTAPIVIQSVRVHSL